MLRRGYRCSFSTLRLIVWLLIATLLGILLRLKCICPISFRPAFPYLGPIRPAHLNALIYGWASMAGNGHRDLADGPALTHHFAASASAHAGSGLLESRGASWESARFLPAIPLVTNGWSFRLTLPSRLFIAYRSSCHGRLISFATGAGSYLHHAMVFVRRVPLVPLALRRRANNAFHFSRAGRDAGGG